MEALVALLVSNGWKFRPPATSIPPREAFPKNIPDEIYDFCRTFDVLASPDDVAWFFSCRDYTSRSDSAFAWNEFEITGVKCAIDDAHKISVRRFWASHFPFAMSVKDDHQYVAIGVGGTDSGKIYLGEGSDEDELFLLANSMAGFIGLIEDYYAGNEASPVSRFLA